MKTRPKSSCLLFPVLALLMGGCAGPIVVPPLQDPPGSELLPGKFVWHDLLTPDPEGAIHFYNGLFGWEFSPLAGGEYHVIRSGSQLIGGMVDAGKAGLRPERAYWLCGVSCPDVDAAVTTVRAEGGKTVRGPVDLPDRGRIAIVLDAEGAPLQLIHSSSGDPPDRPHQTHQWFWHELVSNAPDRAASFHSQVLGYAVNSVETADGRSYRVLETGGLARAGIAENPFLDTPPTWVPYVLVEDPETLVQKVAGLGGTVVLEPRVEVRNKSLALVLDPMGAPIALQKYGEGR